jgi:hypothetical protein
MKRILNLLVPLVILHASTASAAEPTDANDDNGRARLAEQQRTLSSLWVFASLNYLYCDVIGLMDAKVLKQYENGNVGGVTIDQKFLLGGAILMEVPMSMVFLSTALEPKASRIASIGAGALMTTVQTASLFVTKPTSYYLFSSAAEIATTSFITVYSLLYMKPPAVTPSVEVKSGAFAVKVGLTF